MLDTKHLHRRAERGSQGPSSRPAKASPLRTITAAWLDVPLVTHNLSEFRRVPGLSVETWLTGTA